MVDKVVTAPRLKTAGNGHKPGVDPKARTWTSKSGRVFKLKPVSWMLATQLMQRGGNKPEVPQSVVVYAGGQEAVEYNADDPTYLAKMAEWEAERRYRAMVYCFGNGIDLSDDQAAYKEFVKATEEYYPGAAVGEMQFLYVTSIIDVDELEILMGAIMGQTGITAEGIKDAEAGFSGNGKL